MFNRRMTERDAIVISAVLGLVVFLLVLVVCRPFSWGDESEWQKKQQVASGSAAAATGGAVSGEAISVENRAILNPSGTTLETRINPPAGFERVEGTEDSLAYFLRTYPLKKDGAKVRLYDGKLKENQDAHAAVFKLPLEKENLQQCADSVIRVYAEYYWKMKQYDRISFQFVDGFQADYMKWREGYRIQVGSTQSTWVDSGAYDDSYKNFQKYLRMVFAYSSTISMKKESKKIKLSELRTGDIFLQSGSPGHVVMVVDVCENAEGRKAFLLGQGYMPAQEFQLLKNPAHEEDPWYYVDEVAYPLETPEYKFEKGSLRRLNY